MIDTLMVLSSALCTAPQSVPVRTIDSCELHSMATASVSDALKYCAGVQIKDYGGLGGQKTINVRSMGSHHTGVFLDGVQITNAQNGIVDLGKYTVSMLESVSLVQGSKTDGLPLASEYASASTMYMKSKKPGPTQCNLKASVGSFHTYTVEVQGDYNSKLSYNIQATTSKGDYPFEYHTKYEDTCGIRKNSDIKSLRAQIISIPVNGLQLNGYFWYSDRGLPGGVVRRISDKYTDIGREWNTNAFVSATYLLSHDYCNFKFVAKYTNDYLHYRSDFPENISVKCDNKYHQNDWFVGAVTNYSVNKWSVSLSSDLRASTLSANLKYFTDKVRFDSKSSLSLKYSGYFNYMLTSCYNYVKDNDKSFSNGTYFVSVSKNTGKIEGFLFAKSSFRVPTLNDLYYTQVGNSNLKPETVYQADLGFKFAKVVQVDVYANYIKDRIVALPIRGLYQWTMLNYGKTRSFGVNATADYSYKNHHILANLAWQDDRNITSKKESCYYDLIAYSPKWSWSAVYTFTYKFMQVSVSHMFVGKRYWTIENSIDEPLAAYNCTDLKGIFSFKTINIIPEVVNLFNTNYEIVQRWPMPGRQFKLTVSMNL